MFETKTNIKLHDTDAAGITFFANHFRIAHTAYEAFMKSIGCALDWIVRDAEYFVLIAHAEADYKRPLFYGVNITIAVKAEEIGKSSFTLSYRFRDQEGNEAAVVQTVHVVIDKKSGDSIDIPERLRVGLDSLM